MKRLVPVFIFTFFCILLVFENSILLAQELGPVVDILGEPEVDMGSPNGYAYISVVDPNSGRFMETLDPEVFAIRLSGQEVTADVATEVTGIAMVIVVDRGGIARRGDRRIGQAVELSDILLDNLNVDGSQGADMVALIGIRGQEEGGLTPLVPFTNGDPNRVSNEFETLRTEVVNETTPLYDGIDRAIEWITENPDAQLQDELSHRRPMIVIFSDGIDQKYSNEAHETIIIQKCLENNILLYTVRMGGGKVDTDNMEALATQTHGRYISYTPAVQDETLELFQNIVTQRQSYRVTFPFSKPEGEYKLEVRVLGTPIGDGIANGSITSLRQPLQLTLVSPMVTNFTLSYSSTLKGLAPAMVPLKVQSVAADGILRDPSEVAYFANGTFIGASSSPPDFLFEWDLTTILTSTSAGEVFEYTLVATAEDPHLHTQLTSPPVRIQVTREADPLGIQAWRWLLQNWWLLIALFLLFVGLVTLLIMFIQAKGDARKVVKSTTSALKGVTQRLVTGGPPAQGKLVIIQGANVGREFKLANQITKIGRDQQFCDFALTDSFVSNPHFSIHLEQGQFFIVDEGSKNGTLLNGTMIQSHQRVPILPDAVIQVGETRLQFKRLGGETRPLDAGKISSLGAHTATSAPGSLPTQSPVQSPSVGGSSGDPHIH